MPYALLLRDIWYQMLCLIASWIKRQPVFSMLGIKQVCCYKWWIELVIEFCKNAAFVLWLLSVYYLMCCRIYKPKTPPHHERMNPMLMLKHSSDEEHSYCFHLKETASHLKNKLGHSCDHLSVNGMWLNRAKDKCSNISCSQPVWQWSTLQFHHGGWHLYGNTILFFAGFFGMSSQLYSTSTVIGTCNSIFKTNFIHFP